MDELDAQIDRNKTKRDHSADKLEFKHYEAKYEYRETRER